MKKTLLTLLVLAGISSANTANAQLADGSIAPRLDRSLILMETPILYMII